MKTLLLFLLVIALQLDLHAGIDVSALESNEPKALSEAIVAFYGGIMDHKISSTPDYLLKFPDGGVCFWRGWLDLFVEKDNLMVTSFNAKVDGKNARLILIARFSEKLNTRKSAWLDYWVEVSKDKWCVFPGFYGNPSLETQLSKRTELHYQMKDFLSFDEPK